MARVQSRLVKVGLAKSAFGTPATAPTYVFGVTSGQPINTEMQEDSVNTTWSGRVMDGHDRSGVAPGAAFDMLAMPNSLGLLLYLASGSYSVTGVGPYVHVYKAGDTLPYGTLFALYGTDTYEVDDVKVSELEFSWETAGSLKTRAAFMGTDLRFATAWTGGTDERPAGGLFRGVGGTFEVDSVATTVKSGSIRLQNNVQSLTGSAAVTPEDVFEGMVGVEVSLTVVPQNLNLFREVVTGSASGTTVAAAPYFGDMTQKFVLDANTYVQFNLNRLKFAVDFPEANPEGGPAELTLEGVMSAPAAGDPFSIDLSNSHADYSA